METDQEVERSVGEQSLAQRSRRQFKGRRSGSRSTQRSLAAQSPGQRNPPNKVTQRSPDVQQVQDSDNRAGSCSAGTMTISESSCCRSRSDNKLCDCVLRYMGQSIVLNDPIAGMFDYLNEPYREDNLNGASNTEEEDNTDHPGDWRNIPNHRKISFKARSRNEQLNQLLDGIPQTFVHIWKFVNEVRQDFKDAFMQILEDFVRKIHIALRFKVEREYIQTHLLDLLNNKAQQLNTDTLDFTPLYRAAGQSGPDAATMDEPTFQVPISIIRYALYLNAGFRSMKLSVIVAEMMVQQHETQYTKLTDAAREVLRIEYKTDCLRQVDEYLNKHREMPLLRSRSPPGQQPRKWGRRG